MKENLKHWLEVTRGIYRYVVAANLAYEIHVWEHPLDTDILKADAALYLIGEWSATKDKPAEFSRECLLAHATVNDCMIGADADFKANCKEA